MKNTGNNSDHLDVLTSLDSIISSIVPPLDLEELESKYLKSISRLIPAHAMAFYFFKPGEKKPDRITASGVDMNFLEYYEEKGREVDPLRGWITSQKAPNQSQLLLGLKGWQHHPVYNIVGTASIDFAMQSPVLLGYDIIGTLNFGREVQEGPFSKGDLKAISIISKFMGLAIADSIGYSKRSDYRKKLCDAIDRVGHGIIITDSGYSPQYANNVARDIAERTLGNDHPSESLKHLLSEGSREQGNIGRACMHNLSARFCPVPGSTGGQSLVILEELSPPDKFSMFRELLSPRELQVLQLVERGMTNRQIGDDMKISVNTVKRHLDNLFCKLNVNSRTQLVSTIYRLMGVN